MTTSTRPPVIGIAPGQAAGTRRARRRWARRAFPYGLVAPAAVLFSAVLGYPLVRLVVISGQDYGLRALFSGHSGWIGWANYRAVLTDGQLWPVLARTVLLCATLVAGTLVIGLGVAVMMTRLGRRMRTTVALCLITAWAMPTVAATLVWQWLFQPMYGVANWSLTATGLFGDLHQYDWTARSWSALLVVWLLVVWQAVPFVALTLYAGLSQIPREYYEAAAIDGAGPVSAFRAITLPFLRPILLLVTIMSIIWDFNVFTQIWILTHGGPGTATTTIVVWGFAKAFSANAFGRGAAIAVIAVVLLIGLTIRHLTRLVRLGEETS
ncbi:carbohydrate ABC transporter permease [Actinomadura opuntiae]|uniref:carbohydrate ABC transporter permease n=1 Tax=Actinomadura sp. OS1-43 TaxID=604315 RepID=UPI00255AF3B7|nr:sugar ABC transporter permease [Actinomadura sp. OS1-43]MDL4818488.1 sugar ABC transporter permease [Actinomadura sp. OS1-43]